VNDTTQAREVTAEFRKKLSGMRKLNGDAEGAIKVDGTIPVQPDSVKGN